MCLEANKFLSRKRKIRNEKEVLKRKAAHAIVRGDGYADHTPGVILPVCRRMEQEPAPSFLYFLASEGRLGRLRAR